MEMRNRVSVAKSQDIRGFSECLIPVITINPIGSSRAAQVSGCYKQIDMGVVVEIPEKGLDSKVVNISQPRTGTDVRETTAPVILKQPRRSRPMIEDETVHVTVIIYIRKITTPRLLTIIETHGRTFIRVIVVPVVPEQPVDPAPVG